MVPDLAARADDLSDNRLVPAFRHGPETAGCRNARIMLQPGGLQNIARAFVRIMLQAGSKRDVKSSRPPPDNADNASLNPKVRPRAAAD